MSTEATRYIHINQNSICYKSLVMCVFLSMKNQFTMKLLLFHLGLEKKTVITIVVSLNLMLTLGLLNRVYFLHLYTVWKQQLLKNQFNNVTAEPCKLYFYLKKKRKEKEKRKKREVISGFLEVQSL